MPPSRRPNILIVEDDNKVALKYQRILDKIGDIRIAENSTQFFEQVRDFYPQVILVDLVIEGDMEYEPWEAGIKILERLKEQYPHWENTSVIVVTGRIEPDIEKRCRELGVSEFFRKPIPIDVLRQAVIRLTSV